MKILFHIGNMEKGGAARVVANLSNFLIKDNEITIMTTLERKVNYKLNKKIKIQEIEKKTNNNSNVIIKNFRRLKIIKKIIKKERPNIIISFLPEPCFRILFLKLFNRKLKIIISVRNDPRIEYESLTRKIIMQLLYPLADGIVFQTEEAKKFFNKKIQKKSVIIPNPIGEKFLNTKIKEKKKNIIINVGRLEKQKNQEMLIRAFANIAQDIPSYILEIYGDGTLKNNLSKLISSLNMEARIFLKGTLDDIENKMNEADIFVLSSKYEGMPNALMEAMSMGMACIATDCSCGGPKFLIKNYENGILIEEGNQKELEETLKNIIKDKKTKDHIKNNAMKIKEELNPNFINNKWYEYIKNVNG